VLGGDDRLGAQERRPLHHVGELAHVAWPGVGDEGLLGAYVQALRREAVVSAGLGQESLRQEDDVAAALPKGRQAERQDGQPLVESLLESPLASGGGEVFARGRDDPDVDGLPAGAPDPADLAVLDRREELALERLGQEADLVQEKRAAVGGREEPGLPLIGVGEGAPLEPEHLGLQQGLRNGGAVDSHEPPARAGTGPMEDRREQPLAGAGLALDQNGRRAPAAQGAEDPPHLLTELEDCLAVAH
jgi:hypothetical protein